MAILSDIFDTITPDKMGSSEVTVELGEFWGVHARTPKFGSPPRQFLKTHKMVRGSCLNTFVSYRLMFLKLALTNSPTYFTIEVC